jgi:hypothetical protein
MKFLKPLVFLLCMALVFGLTACSPSTKDVLADAAKKTKDIKNFTANMKADINVTKDGKKTALNMDSKMQVQVKPMNAHMNINMGTNGAKMNMEMYLEDGTGYMKVSNLPQWVKVKNADQLKLSDNSQNINPYDALTMLKKYADKVDLKETSDGYVLQVTSKNGKMDDFIKEYIQKAVPAVQSQELNKIFDNMSIKSLDYTTVIDKKTYYPKSVKVNLKATVKDSDGKTVELEENINGTYSDFNKTKAITVPKDVKDTAFEVPADQLKGL